MSQFHADMNRDAMYDTETKTSIAAVLGFVVSLIGCCLPTGLLGAVLGIFGLIGISRSGGRVGGKGLAIAAIIIGILSTFVQIGAVVVGLSWGRSVYPFGVQVGEFLSHAEDGDYDQARTLITGPLNGVTDGELAAFSADVQDDLGKFVSAPDSLGSLLSGWFELGQVLGQNQVPMSVPIALQFENGRAMTQFVFDQNSLNSGRPTMGDLQIVTAAGDVYRLSDYVTSPISTPPLTPPPAKPGTTSADDDATPPAADPGAEPETDDGP